MRQLLVLLLPAALLLTTACQRSAPAEAVEYVENKQSLPPNERFGELFERVQAAAIFPDGKTFVDCEPLVPTDQIMAAYFAQKDEPDFKLADFVNKYFAPPPKAGDAFRSDSRQPLEAHINRLWPVLTRQPDSAGRGSLIALPYPYIVPGGRFREIYYWDSYFTMLGLQVAGRGQMVEDMVNNFAFLIDSLGFIPNGNRTYYLSRSQPPFFALMVELLAESKGAGVYNVYLAQLLKEYDFWMGGLGELSAQQPAVRHLVRLPDGSVLNRYYDSGDYPRAESWKEDVATAKASGRPAAEVYAHLRAGAASGWDFSSRWLADGKSLATIQTTDLVAVDLNALLFRYEEIIARAFSLAGNATQAEAFSQRAAQRKAAIMRYCWDAQAGFFVDYNWRQQQPSGQLSLAGIYPLFVGLATAEQAARCQGVLEKQFLQAGGLLSTPVNTGQQWDAPNGWAPLQWMAIKGLRNYGADALAATVSARWRALNERVFGRTGQLMEKYNVVDMQLEAGGGEYPVQDGFGWTNGVYLRLLADERAGK